MVFHQISLDQTTLTQEVILMVIEVFGWSNLIQVDFQIRKNLDGNIHVKNTLVYVISLQVIDSMIIMCVTL